MTLNIGCLTRDFVLLVSDRRLTSLPSGAICDDNANKVTVVCGRMALAYTGLSQFKLQRTDEWITKVLEASEFQSSSDAVAILRQEATRYFSAIAATPRQKRHAFVAVGWTKAKTEHELKPHFCRISNFHDSAGIELPTARSSFETRVSIPHGEELPALLAIPSLLSPADLDALRTMLRPLTDPQDMAMVLAQAIRNVATTNAAVGENLLAVCLPKVAVESAANRRDVSLVFGPLHPTAAGSVYLPADGSEVIQYGPNLVCPGMGWTRTSGGPVER